MQRDDVLNVLTGQRQELTRFGVKSVAIFGSVARGESGADSDIDILIVHAPPYLGGACLFAEYRIAETANA
jgi:predicted nucleotidyltransferase